MSKVMVESNAELRISEEWYGNGVQRIGVLQPSLVLPVRLSSYAAGLGDGFGFLVECDSLDTITLAPGSYRFYVLGDSLCVSAEFDLGCKRQRLSIKSKIGGAL